MVDGISGIRPPGFDGPKGARDRSGPAESSQAAKPDKVEISTAGLLLARLRAMPDIRSERVEEIRQQILRGTYVTEEKVNQATDNLVNDFLNGM
jgi:anti-sigma28 factor (negative regulator of flagellin synthesis)